MQKTDWTPSLTDRLTDSISASDRFASDSTKGHATCMQAEVFSFWNVLFCSVSWRCSYVHSKIKGLNPSAWVMVSEI